MNENPNELLNDHQIYISTKHYYTSFAYMSKGIVDCDL